MNRVNESLQEYSVFGVLEGTNFSVRSLGPVALMFILASHMHGMLGNHRSSRGS